METPIFALQIDQAQAQLRKRARSTLFALLQRWSLEEVGAAGHKKLLQQDSNKTPASCKTRGYPVSSSICQLDWIQVAHSGFVWE